MRRRRAFRVERGSGRAGGGNFLLVSGSRLDTIPTGAVSLGGGSISNTTAGDLGCEFLHPAIKLSVDSINSVCFPYKAIQLSSRER